MAETKFTRGRWWVTKPGYVAADYDNDRYHGVAVTLSPDGSVESEADTHLIAAAPELYNLGEKLENQITLWAADVFELPDTKLDQDIVEIVLNVRECREILSLLARARGEATNG